MAHGPKRPQGLDGKATAQVAASLKLEQPAPPAERRWRDEFELAVWMSDAAHMGKHVRLTPATAQIVACHLSTIAAKPTRDEVALMICGRGEAGRCQEPCTTCRGKANIVVQAYGMRLGDPRPGGS